jgi:hypothetical protein
MITDKTTTDELFSIVPQRLTASNKFTPSEKLVLTAILGKHRIKRADGEPWTYSVSLLAKWSSVSESTAKRTVRRLRGLRILKRHGFLVSGKTKYFIYSFNQAELESVILTTVNLTPVKCNDTKAESGVTGSTPIINDGQFDLLEGRKIKVTVQSEEQKPETVTTESLDEQNPKVTVPKDRTATAAEIWEELKKEKTNHSVPSRQSDSTKELQGKDKTTSIPSVRPENGELVTSHKPNCPNAKDSTNDNGQTNDPNHSARPETFAYEPNIEESIPLKVPSSVGLSPSCRRQDYIVKTINKEHGLQFIKEGPMGCSIEGYAVCAYDSKNQGVLITCDDFNYVTKPHFQKLCQHFVNKDWCVWVWVGSAQSIVGMVQGNSVIG